MTGILLCAILTGGFFNPNQITSGRDVLLWCENDVNQAQFYCRTILDRPEDMTASETMAAFDSMFNYCRRLVVDVDSLKRIFGIYGKTGRQR